MPEPPNPGEPHASKSSAVETGAASESTDPQRRPARPTELARTLAASSGDGRQLTPASTDSEPRAVDPEPHSFETRDPAGRYELRKLLGEGGMGAVHLCRDAWIGREVAMKVVRDPRQVDSGTLGRFIREARVQGQLEHPSIVPVYDIGARPDGAAYFTMKRVRGVTLAEVVDGLRAGDAGMTAIYSRRKLVSALSQACLAIAFAHSRGVVHRDLKPENVMLGDFGEVYVLDWGVARIEGAQDFVREAIASDDSIVKTEAGALLGTPGYAAPEQVRGEGVSPSTDVYALGAMLFELITLEPLHRGATARELLVATLSPVNARPSQRAPGLLIAPELDEICARATAFEPEARFPSARELGAAIDRYLSGERDAAHKHELAQRHVVQAQLALALAARGAKDAEHQRARGVRELGAALALDPTHQGALSTLMQTLLDVPDELPPEARKEFNQINRRDRAKVAKNGMFGYLSMWLASPLLFFMGVKNWPFLIALELVAIAAVAYSGWMWKTNNAVPRYMIWMVPLNFLLVGLLSLLFGPFVLVPGLVATSAAIFMVGIRANRRTRRGILILGLASVFVPAGLELGGLAAPSYAIEDGVLKILPTLVGFPPGLTLLLLAFVSLMTVLTSVVMVGRAVENLVTAERRSFAQAWRLRQLLPREATQAS